MAESGTPAENESKINVMELISQLEDQQKSIGSLQVRLNVKEEEAANLDNRVFQMRALLQSGKGFSQIHTLSDLLDAFMAVCRERYAAVNSTVLLLDDLDPNDIYYRVRGYVGLPEMFVDKNGVEEEMFMFKIPRDQGLLWQLIHQGDVFAVRDMRKLPRFETAFNRWNLGVLQSDIWVPLLRGADVLGILTLGECEDGSQIPETDYQFLEEIAAVAATNIDSTLKYEKNNRILNNLRTLYDINQQLVNVNDFKHLMEETLSTAVKALKAQKANLMLYNPETDRLEIKVVSGNIPLPTRNAINEGYLDTRSFKIGEGVAGLAAQTRKPVRINDRSQIDQFGRYPVYCMLSVPMIYGKEVEGVITLTNKVKEDENGEMVVHPLSRFDEDDEQLLVSLADQAASNLNKARLYNASITDRLTGLANSRYFESQFAELVDEAQRKNEPLCLAIVDIDHFKRFNDDHGHQAGDFVLRSTAEILQAHVRKQSDDRAFRYGGEEFCMLMPNTEISRAAELAEQFRTRLAEATFGWESEELKITASVGVACSTDFDHSISLFDSADTALYFSKDRGRNRVTFFREGSLWDLEGQEFPPPNKLSKKQGEG